ncbi:hypothetical protein AB0V89_23580 [Escherichia coli]|uniref:hypothetical protein n=1 Tax=Enterobacteriaceae TaxID=543 RepID=UPI000775287C|nr:MULTISPECIES: hypothetical protein [Enterobacteriaceae]MDU4226551.1 hypothetical protein [Klebsiella grimontii]EGD9106793.1 hypothetical protein [Escherichia coli]EGE2361534.1 hypothetical protein [Escherichia coli]KXP89815.1 hypothetical protein AUP77_02065 [Escherichia coli]OIY12936.1 hypothetical protein BED45_07295 [Citrobacter freundii]
MKNIKIITIFRSNENIPFMTCIVNDIEENKNGIKLTLENGENINIKDYGYFFLSEAEGDMDRERMVSSYRRLISKLSQISEETVKSLML